MQLRKTFPLVLLSGVILCGCPGFGLKGETIRAKDLPPESILELKDRVSVETFREIPTRVKGVVTWVDKTAGKRFYIQDQTGGILVTFDGDVWPEPGDLVEIEGTLTRGPIFPLITHATLLPLGRGEPPPPTVISWTTKLGAALLNGNYNGERVEVNGWIRTAEMISPTTLAAVLNSGADRIKVRISNAQKLKPEDLIAHKVQIRGVAVPVMARGAVPRLVEAQMLASNFPKQMLPYIRQLIEVQVHVARPEDINIRLPQVATIAPWNRPLTPLRKIFEYHPARNPRGDWIHVRGEVVYAKDGITYLSDGESGLAVRGVGISPFQCGDWVEAVGFPDLEGFLPVLADAMIIPAKQSGAPVASREVPAAKLLDDRWHASYVSVTGQLLDRMQAPHEVIGDPAKPGESTLVLALQVPHDVFTAELESKNAGPLLPNVEIGSTLKISGVCIVRVDSMGRPAAFMILVPSPEQITVIRPASIFTVKRLLVVLSIALGVLLVATWLVYFFARRNIRLRAALHERQAVAAERSRLARDLHDTLQQGLVGIQYRLQSIGPSSNEASPETQESLEAVRSLVAQCYAETRQSIWNLRSGEAEDVDLGKSLERAARMLVRGSPIKIEFRQERTAVEIPRMIEDNLLHIGREALMNAVTHAKASRLKIDLVVSCERVDLTVSDNGCGFSKFDSPPGHFGLQGMWERERRIGGKLTITSAPGEGCVIRIRVPLRRSPVESQRI